jgi:hypothetical protein
VSYEVIEEYEPVSGHRSVVATFNLEAAIRALKQKRVLHDRRTASEELMIIFGQLA